VGQHVLQEEQLAIRYARQAGAEATGGAAFGLRGDRL